MSTANAPDPAATPPADPPAPPADPAAPSANLSPPSDPPAALAPPADPAPPDPPLSITVDPAAVAAPADPPADPIDPPPPSGETELEARLRVLEASNAASEGRLSAASSSMSRALLDKARVLGKYARVFEADNPGFDPFAADADTKIAAWAANNRELLAPTAQETAPPAQSAADLLKDLGPNASLFNAEQLQRDMTAAVESGRSVFSKLGIN